MNVNKHIIIGRIGQEPQLNQVGETVVLNFSVATNEFWRGKDGKKKEKTTWHNVAAWGKLGQSLSDKIKKGALLYVEGPSNTKTWTDKNGVEKQSTEINAKTIRLLEAKGTHSKPTEDINKSFEEAMSGMAQVQANPNYTTDEIPF